LGLRVVIDTNIYISAIFWDGNPRKVIDLGRDGEIEIYTSKEIEEEIYRVLLKKFNLNPHDAEQILFDFSTFTILVKPLQQFKVIKDDPDDDKFIDCAIACNADYIVSQIILFQAISILSI
jgi:putative PIN family toxin of toxin-antitoxin system